MTEAVELVKAGKKAEARELLRDTCRANPAIARAWFLRASLAETVPEAVGYLERVLTLEPENSSARAWFDRLRPTVVEVQTYHCFLCPYEGPEEFRICPQCHANLTLDIPATLQNDRVDDRQVRIAIDHFKALGEGADPFDVAYFLGVAELNLRNSHAALQHFRRAVQCDSLRGAQLRPTVTELERRPLIMAVDDCLTIRTMIANTLERNGYRCLTVTGGVEALSYLEEISPEFVLLDVSMPFMDGYTLCKTIKSRPQMKGTAVVMLSGRDGFLDKVKGRMSGAADYLTKPFEPALLLRVIRKYVHTKE